MTYRSLTVLVDDDPTCSARTEFAIAMAKRFDCHLVGLVPTGLIELPLRAEASGSLPEYAARAWASLEERAKSSADRFSAACRAAAFKSFESVVDRCEATKSLLQHAQCSDLLILTQADPSRSDYRPARDVIERLVFASPRPTLVLPYAGRFEAVGRRAMVAWDDSRESARSLADAMPLLLGAERVNVETWNETRTDGDADALRLRLDQLHRWLMWHGVAAHLRVETTTVGIADAILSRAADLTSDLIVMGAYGHARWAERVLGGATRGVLDAMTVPVLMSH